MSVNIDLERIQLGGQAFTVVDGQIYTSENKPVQLRAKSSQVLLALLDRRGHIVSKQHLANSVWPNSIASDETVSRCIADIRKFLGPEAKEILQTYPKRGYCLVVNKEGAVEVDGVALKNRKEAELATVDTDESGLNPKYSKQQQVLRTKKLRLLGAPPLLLFGVLGAALFVMSFFSFRTVSTGTPVANARPLLALQPLSLVSNTTTTEESRSLQQALTDDLNQQLTQISGLSVLSSTLVRRLDWSVLEIDEIEAKTGASHLLRGELSQADGQIRVKVELTNVSNRKLMWSGDFVGSEETLLTTMNQLLEQLLKELGVSLSAEDYQRLEALKNINPVAYQYILDGRRLANRFNYEDSLAAERAFRKAIQADPGYAQSYAEAAVALAIRLENDWSVQPTVDAKRGVVFAEKAIELDSSLALAHYGLGRIYTIGPDRNFAAGEEHLKIAMALQPDNDDARVFYAAIKNFKNETAVAISIMEAAIASHPAPPFWYYLGYGHSLNLAGRFEEAEENFDTCLAQQPSAPYCLRYQIVNYVNMNRVEDAIWALDEYQMLGFEPSADAMMETMYNISDTRRAMMRDAFIAAGATP